MITKWIQFTVAEDRVADFEKEMARIQEASRKETGCAHYSAFRSVQEVGLFTVLECWESVEALDAHRVSSHIAEFKAKCGVTILDKEALDLREVGKA